MQAIIKLEVPEYQIGQEVTIYFKDTMKVNGICTEDNSTIKEFEQVKVEIRNKKDGYGKYPVCDNCIKIIDKHISKLKGEKNETDN